jgi:hypothetical protein
MSEDIPPSQSMDIGDQREHLDQEERKMTVAPDAEQMTIYPS